MHKLLKQYGLWFALALTIVATIWTSQQETELEVATNIDKIELTENTPIQTHENSEPNTSDVIRLVLREANQDEASDLFGTFKPIENISELESPAPVTANPFTYAGKLVDEGKVTVFLIDGDKSHAVKVGSVIEELWKVKSIRPPIMVLKNLSNKSEVSIEIGALS